MILSKIASNWKTYLLAALTLGLSFFYARSKHYKSKLISERQQDAEAQRDQLINANESMEAAQKEGRRREDKAIKDAESGDWSGFNDGV